MKSSAFGKFNKTLNFTNYYDCKTGEDLVAWSNFSRHTCELPEYKGKSSKNMSIYFKSAFQPKLVVGQTIDISAVKELDKTNWNQ